MAINHTTDEIRDYFLNNLNKSNRDLYTLLLNLDVDVYQDVMDLLLEYRIGIWELKSITPFNSNNVRDFINTYKLNKHPYIRRNELLVDGYNYILTTLGMNETIIQSVINESNNNTKDIFNYIPKISVGDYFNKVSYKNMQQFVYEFNNRVLPELLTHLGCMTSFKEKLPTTDLDIESMFSSVIETYTVDGIVYNCKDFGIKLYKDIFSNLFSSIDYLSNDNLVYMMFKINGRYSKLEAEARIFNDILNFFIPNKYTKSFMNEIIMDIETNGILPDSSYIIDMYNSVISLDYEKKLKYSMTKYHILDLISLKYSTDNNSMGLSYNTGFKQIYDIIIERILLFKDLIEKNKELADKYLLTI